ncbi:unnamed protein product [Anisakis simplex]|uniref:CC domain-containing protein n=1 Tax=Anisakis simplex TaxID=6269 RepID=A0A0M3K815_ANISI|nr:unnamed protein product [Anisakis simplex]
MAMIPTVSIIVLIALGTLSSAEENALRSKRQSCSCLQHACQCAQVTTIFQMSCSCPQVIIPCSCSTTPSGSIPSIPSVPSTGIPSVPSTGIPSVPSIRIIGSCHSNCNDICQRQCVVGQCVPVCWNACRKAC